MNPTHNILHTNALWNRKHVVGDSSIYIIESHCSYPLFFAGYARKILFHQFIILASFYFFSKKWFLVHVQPFSCYFWQAARLTNFSPLNYTIQVLRTRQTTTVHGSSIPKGLSDVAFTSNDTRLITSPNLQELLHMLGWNNEILIQCHSFLYL